MTDTGAVPRAETQGCPAGVGAVAEIDGNWRCGGDGPRFLSSLLGSPLPPVPRIGSTHPGARGNGTRKCVFLKYRGK